MDIMTEVLFSAWIGGLSTRSTYGNGVPIYGCSPEISNFSTTSIDCFPFIGSGNHQRLKFLDKSLGFILNEHIDASSP